MSIQTLTHMHAWPTLDPSPFSHREKSGQIPAKTARPTGKTRPGGRKKKKKPTGAHLVLYSVSTSLGISRWCPTKLSLAPRESRIPFLSFASETRRLAFLARLFIVNVGRERVYYIRAGQRTTFDARHAFLFERAVDFHFFVLSLSFSLSLIFGWQELISLPWVS